jgi:hypothetical protein
MRVFFSLVIFLLWSGPGFTRDFTAGSVTVSHPWARATPAGAKTGAAYMQIDVKPGASDRLIGVKSDVAGSAELHSSVHEGGVMKMRRVDGLPLEGKGPVILQPGGYHVMLVELKKPLKEGDALKLTLVFEKAGELPIEATIEPIGAKGAHGMGEQPAASQGAAHKH